MPCTTPIRCTYISAKRQKGMQRPRDSYSPSNLKRYAHLFRDEMGQSDLEEARATPEIVVLEECASTEMLDEAERFWIAQFKAMGMSLMNGTDGGDGAPARIARMRVQRCRRRERPRWRQQSKERERMTEMAQNFWDDPVASAKERERRAAELRDKPRTPEVVAKIAAGLQGKPKSPEHRAKIARACTAALARSSLRRQSSHKAACRERPIRGPRAGVRASVASLGGSRVPCAADLGARRFRVPRENIRACKGRTRGARKVEGQ